MPRKGMGMTHEMSKLIAAFRISLLLLATLASQAHADTPDDEAYLDQLQGTWDMTGTLGKQSLHYHASGERVLQGSFIRLHMIDAAPKPKYEADVFIGFDPQSHDFIAHWLDRFGAAGARVVGSGKRDGRSLVIIFPYTDGAFRDTFTYMADKAAWSLLLEAQKPDGTWSTFASYTLTQAN
jgi:hypothetical protein